MADKRTSSDQLNMSNNQRGFTAGVVVLIVAGLLAAGGVLWYAARQRALGPGHRSSAENAVAEGEDHLTPTGAMPTEDYVVRYDSAEKKQDVLRYRIYGPRKLRGYGLDGGKNV